MANIKQLPMRFNLDNKDEAKAYNYLTTMDKTIYPSYTKAVTVAVINLFENANNRKSEFEVKTLNPAFSFSERIGNADAIADAVIDKIDTALPQLVAATLMQLLSLGENSMPVKSSTQQKIEEKEPMLSESVWEYLDNL